MNGLVVKIIRMCERGDSGARELRREEKRRRELRHYFMAMRAMRPIEDPICYFRRAVGRIVERVERFYSGDEKYRQGR